ncbi:MAG: fliX [Rhodospirillales bacterium]|nr:fliX [Rhodospirillales bacterium]
MRVDGSNPIRPAAGRRDGKSRTSVAGAFGEVLGSETVAEPVAAAPLVGVGALFALQEVPDPTTGRRKAAVARGDLLLDKLGDIQLGLLEGKIDRQGLTALAAAVRGARATTSDPELQGVLDQIELRAAVELEKLTVAG